MNEKKQIFLAPEPEIMTIITVMVVLAAAILLYFGRCVFIKEKRWGSLTIWRDMSLSISVPSC